MTDRPHVLMMIGGLDPTLGGSERQMNLLLTNIPEESLKKHVACFVASDRTVADMYSKGITVHKLPQYGRFRWIPKVFSRLVSIIREHRIQLVHAMLPTFDILAPCLKLAIPRLHVITSRRSLNSYLTKRDIFLLRSTGILADYVIANSEAVAESVRRTESLGADKLRVIPNGIELPAPLMDEEREAARKNLGPFEDDAFVITYVAHFRHGKGYEILPSVIKAVQNKVPRVRWIIAGDTSLNDRFRERYRLFVDQLGELGVDRLVRIMGRVDDIRPLYAAADALVNLSDSEGMSNALLEAMAHGVPILATDVGGTREIVGKDLDQVLIRHDSVQDAVEKIDLLTNDKDKAQEIGRLAHIRIMKEFSIPTMIDRYLELYGNLIFGDE